MTQPIVTRTPSVLSGALVFAGTRLPVQALIDYLEGKGFRVIDMCDALWRPGDGALWQMDLWFAPASRPEFARNTYQP